MQVSHQPFQAIPIRPTRFCHGPCKLLARKSNIRPVQCKIATPHSQASEPAAFLWCQHFSFLFSSLHACCRGTLRISQVQFLDQNLHMSRIGLNRCLMRAIVYKSAQDHRILHVPVIRSQHTTIFDLISCQQLLLTKEDHPCDPMK